MRPVLSLKELAEELGVGRHTARRIAEEIGVRLAGRRVLVSRARLDEWLEGGDAMAIGPVGKQTAPGARPEAV